MRTGILGIFRLESSRHVVLRIPAKHTRKELVFLGTFSTLLQGGRPFQFSFGRWSMTDENCFVTAGKAASVKLYNTKYPQAPMSLSVDCMAADLSWSPETSYLLGCGGSRLTFWPVEQ